MQERLTQLYESVGVRDLVEIGILALAIFVALRLLGKTRGAGLVRGLGLIVVALFLTLVIKTYAIYPEPFWRQAGLNGQAASDTGPVKVTFDNSPPSGTPGVLMGFIEGKEARTFEGRDYLLERGIVGDFSLAAAWKGDRLGNLVYRKSARNFNPMAVTAGRISAVSSVSSAAR